MTTSLGYFLVVNVIGAATGYGVIQLLQLIDDKPKRQRDVAGLVTVAKHFHFHLMIDANMGHMLTGIDHEVLAQQKIVQECMVHPTEYEYAEYLVMIRQLCSENTIRLYETLGASGYKKVEINKSYKIGNSWVSFDEQGNMSTST